MNRLLLSSALLCVFAASSPAATLLPHRAYYDLTAARVDQGGGVSTVRGKLAFELQGSTCEGYTVNHRMATRVTFVEGGTQTRDWQASSFESGDGLELEVSQKQFVDASPFSETRIKVKKNAHGEKGRGEMIKPSEKKIETDAAALFPIAHQLQVINKALQGEKRDVTLVYYGRDDEKHYKVVSFIGALRQPADIEKSFPSDARDVVNSGKAWNVSTSYYKSDSKADDAPEYQASFIMLENGVTSDLVLDYGTYALNGKLTKLEVLKAAPCN